MKLRSQIFMAAFALGILPLLTLVGVNLSGHIKRHEEVVLQQAKTLQELELVNLDAEIVHYRQTLAAIAQLPEVQRLVAAGTAPSRELLGLLNSWLSNSDAILEINIYDRQDVKKLGLLRNDQFFAIQNTAPANRPVHNRITSTGELILSTTIEKDDNAVTASFRIDAEIFLRKYLDSYWIDPVGSYLRQPYEVKLTIAPETNAFEDFPRLQPLLSIRKATLWESTSGYTVTWMPILLDGLRPALWIGTPVDRTAAIKWKNSLIANIITIIMIMSVIIFLIANAIARKTDSIKEQLLEGLDQVLNHNQEFSFTWSGPKEITTMAEDLSKLARQYVKTSCARKEAEAALLENQENFRNLANSAQDAIVLMDHTGNISYWNQTAEEMFGYRRNEVLGKPIHNLISPRLLEGPAREIIQSRPPGEGPIRETIELITKKRNGTDLPVELSLSETRVKDEWHSIWIIRDISERKWAEEKNRLHQQQLLQADKMVSLGLLVSGVAHEINNPNSIALLNTPMLAKAWASIKPILESYYLEHGEFLVAGLEYSEMRQQIPKLFQELEESCKRIKYIVKDLKDYARQDNTTRMELIDINEIARAAARLTGNLIKNRTSTFIARYAPNVPLIRGNGQRLEQVIINLIQNSCDALENNQAAITLETGVTDDDREVFVRVSDEGCGIPPEEMNKVTDPFFTTKRNTGGTGLGLSVSAGIIKEHGGSINFSSLPGQGTTVNLTFPVEAAGQADAQES